MSAPGQPPLYGRFFELDKGESHVLSLPTPPELRPRQTCVFTTWRAIVFTERFNVVLGECELLEAVATVSASGGASFTPAPADGRHQMTTGMTIGDVTFFVAGFPRVVFRGVRDPEGVVGTFEALQRSAYANPRKTPRAALPARVRPCGGCQGFGLVPCPKCGGRGRKDHPMHFMFDHDPATRARAMFDCPTCAGEGAFLCQNCRGSGVTV